jgi:hypothetical protein
MVKSETQDQADSHNRDNPSNDKQNLTKMITDYVGRAGLIETLPKTRNQARIDETVEQRSEGIGAA